MQLGRVPRVGWLAMHMQGMGKRQQFGQSAVASVVLDLLVEEHGWVQEKTAMMRARRF